MSTEFIEILDHALERLRGKDSISEILESYADQAEYLAPILNTTEALNTIPPVEMPPDEVMQMDRVEFLAELEILEVPSVSPGLVMRLKEQMMAFAHRLQFDNSYIRKEKKNMSMLFARATFVIALLFGATGGAYAMADNSLPNEPMYGAKLAMEQIQLQMKTGPADVAGYHLVMAEHRIKETIRLAQAGKVPDEGMATRLEKHLNTAYQLAAQLGDDAEMQGVLTQAKTMLQEHIQALGQVQAHVSTASQARLQLTIQLLTQAQIQAENGLQDINAFRMQYRNQMGDGVPGSADCPNCPCDGCDPAGVQSQYQYQNQLREGAPGSADCPNCPCDGCDPDGAQNQNQFQNQNGQQTGDGTNAGQSEDSDCPNCPCVDCDGDQDRDRDQDQDRDRDQSCDNPQPGQPQPGECPNCPCEDCVPEGEQNQKGGKP